MKTKEDIPGMIPLDKKARIELEAILYEMGVDYPEDAKREQLIALIRQANR